MVGGDTAPTLAGRTILVTGGGSGIGRACARRLAAEGAAVTVCGRTAERLEETARLVAGETGARVGVVVADVTDEEQVAAAVAAAADDEGHLWGLVANAGGGGALAPYHLQDVAEFRRVLELNVIGTMLCVKHAVPPMVAGGGGSIVASPLWPPTSPTPSSVPTPRRRRASRPSCATPPTSTAPRASG